MRSELYAICFFVQKPFFLKSVVIASAKIIKIEQIRVMVVAKFQFGARKHHSTRCEPSGKTIARSR